MKIGNRTAGRIAMILGFIGVLGFGSLTVLVSQASEHPAEVGELGPLIPFHKDAIHAGVIWTNGHDHGGHPAGANGGAKTPKVLFWMRPSEYRGTDSVDESLVAGIVADPNATLFDALRPIFEQLVFGGFGFSANLDESVATRFTQVDLPLENTLLFCLNHPDAFQNTGKFNVEDLTEADAALNANAFEDAGYSQGLNYNLFCAGNVQLTDGKFLVIGGHDKGGNNGIRKLNIYCPDEGWVERTLVPVREDFEADPDGTGFVHADPLDETMTDPPDPSDMLFQRWYPTAVTMPDGRVLCISGTDQDTSDVANARFTKVRITVPEVYDPKTDRVTPLFNAQKHFSMYPRAYVVQTGPNPRDWAVAVRQESLMGDPDYADPNDPNTLIESVRRGYDPWTYTGKTYYLDVLGALADPSHTDATLTLQDSNHWTFVDEAASAHNDGGDADLVEIGFNGRTISHKVVAFGGEDGRGSSRNAIVEMIDFANSNPEWELQDPLSEPADQNNAVILPDGKVVVMGGTDRRNVRDRVIYHMFDPQTGEMRVLLNSSVPRFDHSTALLMPDATVLVVGGNRANLMPPDPTTGEARQELRDLMVPNGRIYSPPYLYNPDGSPADRPVIERSPHTIDYANRFRVRVSCVTEIESVVIIRTGPITHNWAWGNRYVKLPFETTGRNRLRVKAPRFPAQAIAGDYMLFVVDENGVPSEAKHVRLRLPEPLTL